MNFKQLVLNRAAHKALTEASEALKPLQKFRFREHDTGSVWDSEAKDEAEAWSKRGLEFCEFCEIDVTARSNYDPEASIRKAHVSNLAQVEFTILAEEEIVFTELLKPLVNVRRRKSIFQTGDKALCRVEPKT